MVRKKPNLIMNSRDAILKAIQRNKPSPTALPKIPLFAPAGTDLLTAFEHMVSQISGTVVSVPPDASVAEILAEAYPQQSVICSAVPDLVRGTIDLFAVEDPHLLAGVDLFVCRGDFGVAENGAIWVRASQMGHRAAPFIAQHLALVLDRTQIVANMHAAYARMQVDEDGYGVFIAGPSKTADIEQSLVIGAHGPRSLTVVLM